MICLWSAETGQFCSPHRSTPVYVRGVVLGPVSAGAEEQWYTSRNLQFLHSGYLVRLYIVPGCVFGTFFSFSAAGSCTGVAWPPTASCMRSLQRLRGPGSLQTLSALGGACNRQAEVGVCAHRAAAIGWQILRSFKWGSVYGPVTLSRPRLL